MCFVLVYLSLHSLAIYNSILPWCLWICGIHDYPTSSPVTLYHPEPRALLSGRATSHHPHRTLSTSFYSLSRSLHALPMPSATLYSPPPAARLSTPTVNRRSYFSLSHSPLYYTATIPRSTKFHDPPITHRDQALPPVVFRFKCRRFIPPSLARCSYHVIYK